ncbi:hypothetical protein PTE30175_03452 [Pandoraea terrae]|uniref:Uncharacterized protein n=1 Tax=Pandoraea terrae TaxID=1537710 RepID=A0A5E4WYF7_9BURK|nr:hypothetical protein PTE30175_03452 [Pandoraea terrae]
MKMRWEKLYSGGLGEFHESPEAHRRAMRMKRALWGLMVVALVVGVASASVVWHWQGDARDQIKVGPRRLLDADPVPASAPGEAILSGNVSIGPDRPAGNQGK